MPMKLHPYESGTDTGLCPCFSAVAFTEFIHLPDILQNLLLPSIEGVAGSANLNRKFIHSIGRANGQAVTTGTSHLDLMIFRVDIGFHRTCEPSNTTYFRCGIIIESPLPCKNITISSPRLRWQTQKSVDNSVNNSVIISKISDYQ